MNRHRFCNPPLTRNSDVGARRVERAPVLGVLALIGLVAGRRPKPFIFLMLTSIAWYCVSFGRPTWGAALSILPFSSELHPHRMVGPIQLLAPVSAGVGLAWLVRWLRGPQRVLGGGGARVASRIVVAGLLGVALASAVLERHASARRSRFWAEGSRQAFAENSELAATIDRLGSVADSGRIYAGRAQDFGRTFKIGEVPCYALLAGARVPALSYLYMAMSPASDNLPLYDPWRLDHNEVFGVSMQLLPDSVAVPEFARVIDEGAGFRVLELPTTPWFSLVNVVSDLRVVTEQERYETNREWLSSERPGRGEVFRLVRSPDVAVAERMGYSDAIGAIDNVQVGLGRWSADIDVRQATHLLLKTTYHPRLLAEVDGQPAPVDELSLHFAGVCVGPGRHVVRVRYEPRRWRAHLMWLALALFGVWIGGEEYAGRRRARTPRSES